MAKKKNKERIISIIFLILREESLGHKDVDHILPFLYFLSKSNDIKYTARGIIFDNKKNYIKSLDPRIKLLSKLKNVKLDFLYEDNIIFKIKQFLKLEGNSFFANFLNRIVNKIYINYLNKVQNNINFESRLGKDFIKSDFPLIITMHSNYRVQKFISQIKKKNQRAKWMILPHGTTVADNKMNLISDLNKEEVSKNENRYSNIDFFLQTSKRDLEEECSKGMPKNKGFVIGSPRFCMEWMKIKSNLKLDSKKVINSKNYKIKALFCLPKKDQNIFWDELIRSIDFISSYKKIDLIILNYNNIYPKIPNSISKRLNVRQYLISKEYSTSELIEWADVVFHAGTSVIFEFFIKDKISVFLRHLSCNTLISDKHYNAGLNLSNRDELRTFCNDAIFSLKKLKKNYKKKCKIYNKKFIDDFVYGNSKSVKQNIIKTLLKIRDRF